MEEEVLQPVDRWVQEQRQRCEDTPCNPWLLCLNTLVCWLVWVAVKIIEWVIMLVIRWVLRPICVFLMLIIGVLALLIGNTEILIQALVDLWEFIKDAFFFALGFILHQLVIFADFVSTAIGWQDPKRKLTKEELAELRPIFGDSLLYNLIQVNEGRLGIMGPPFATGGATTIGYNIYLREYSLVTLVHECVHVWQFQFGGTHYIGQSVIHQAINRLGGANSYLWHEQIGTDVNSWYLLSSVEAQAEFIEDLYNFGRFDFDDGRVSDESNGAFFSGQPGGRNRFFYAMISPTDETGDPSRGAVEYTDIANAAWTVLRTG